MNFLITGAAGFLGSALANHLSKQGHQVRGIDDLSTGDKDALSPDVHFTRGDVNDRPKLWTLLQDVDVVYHLAARVSVPESVLYPREYNAVNVGGTVSLMEAMRDVGVRRVIMASSGAVYGDVPLPFDKLRTSPSLPLDGEGIKRNIAQKLTEATQPNPRSPYAVSKLSAEHYIRTIGTLWGMETVSLRIFNAYGPGQNIPASHPPVVPHFIKQTLRNGTLVIHNDGKQTRDYVYVDDVVKALVAAMTAPNLDGMVINVGSGTETSVRDLVKSVTKIVPGEAEVIYNPRVSGGVSQMCADLSLAKEKLGYQPSISLDEGLKLTLERDARFTTDVL